MVAKIDYTKGQTKKVNEQKKLFAICWLKVIMIYFNFKFDNNNKAMSFETLKNIGFVF
jgi:hypothetical protein